MLEKFTVIRKYIAGIEDRTLVNFMLGYCSISVDSSLDPPRSPARCIRAHLSDLYGMGTRCQHRGLPPPSLTDPSGSGSRLAQAEVMKAAQGTLSGLAKGEGRVLAGSGAKSGRALDVAGDLAKKYGGKASDYQGVPSKVIAEGSNGAKVEVHAFRNVETGRIYDPKNKSAGRAMKKEEALSAFLQEMRQNIPKNAVDLRVASDSVISKLIKLGFEYPHDLIDNFVYIESSIERIMHDNADDLIKLNNKCIESYNFHIESFAISLADLQSFVERNRQKAGRHG